MLHKILTHSSYAFSWEHNLSYTRFKDRFGEAVAADPELQHGIFEWKRKVQRSSGSEEAFCCPQDVRRSPKCKHDDISVCSLCDIPICNDCWILAINNEAIPQAIANDNFIGYAHRFLVERKVTWLEATIAAPAFSGLVT